MYKYNFNNDFSFSFDGCVRKEEEKKTFFYYIARMQ